jgi:hypothetical protein
MRGAETDLHNILRLNLTHEALQIEILVVESGVLTDSLSYSMQQSPS